MKEVEAKAILQQIAKMYRPDAEFILDFVDFVDSANDSLGLVKKT